LARAIVLDVPLAGKSQAPLRIVFLRSFFFILVRIDRATGRAAHNLMAALVAQVGAQE
jgi:hypothetical protein